MFVIFALMTPVATLQQQTHAVQSQLCHKFWIFLFCFVQSSAPVKWNEKWNWLCKHFSVKKNEIIIIA